MTDAAHEAYERLRWQQANRPSHEELKRIEDEHRREALASRFARLRRGVA